MLDTSLQPMTLGQAPAEAARLQVLDAGAVPARLAISNDGRFLAFADRDGDQVSLFDAATLSVIHTIDTCDGPRAFGTFLLGGHK